MNSYEERIFQSMTENLDTAIGRAKEILKELQKPEENKLPDKLIEWQEAYKRYMRICEDEIEIDQGEFMIMLFLANDTIKLLTTLQTKEYNHLD